MNHQYYFTEYNNELIYISLLYINDGVEASLYIGNKLVTRKSFQRGIFILSKSNIKLKLHIKYFKIFLDVTIDNQKVQLQKVKRKELQTKLRSLNITNELNPKPKAPISINYSKLKTPIILIIIGLVNQILTLERGGIWELPFPFFYFIGYCLLFSPYINQIPVRHLGSEETRGQLKFLAGFVAMFITGFLIYNFL